MLSLFSCKRFLTPSFKANTKKNQMDAKLLLFHEVVTSVKQGVFFTSQLQFPPKIHIFFQLALQFLL